MELHSSAFTHNGMIPRKYSQHGEDINPPLEIRDVPAEAKSLALIVEDPDVPTMAGVPVWDHWVVFNIPPTISSIAEHWQVDGTRGKGTRGKLEWSGPKPPDREHRYFFKLFALDDFLPLEEGATKQEVLDAIQGHVLAEAELLGTYAPE